MDYKVNNENAKSLLTTSGLEKSDPIGSNIARQVCNTEGGLVFKLDHNHPARATSEWSSGGDREMRDVVLENNSNASVNIHFKVGNKWKSRSIKHDTKYHFKGEFN